MGRVRTVLRDRLADPHRPASSGQKPGAGVDLRGAVRAASSRAEPIERGDGEEGTEVRPPTPACLPRTAQSVSLRGHHGRVGRGEGWSFLVTKLRDQRSRSGLQCSLSKSMWLKSAANAKVDGFLMNPFWSLVASWAVLVSALWQSQSLVCLYNPLFWISFPSGLPQSTDQGSLNHTAGSHRYLVSREGGAASWS